MFLRVGFLHRLAPTLNSAAVGLTHLGVIILFLALIGYFDAALLRKLRERRRVPSNESAESLGEHLVVSTGQD
jgi:uncharacterized membrane protein